MSSITDDRTDVELSPTVYVVDDDPDFSIWLSAALDTIHARFETFNSPTEFLDRFDRDKVGCIVLDVRLPEMSGLELQKRLMAMRVRTPIVLVSAYGDVSIAVEALKAGAVDFIQKPCSAQALIDRIQRAIAIGRERHQASREAAEIRSRMASLSPREVETMELLLEGKSTKDIASALDIGMTTVDFHRKNLLEKMRVDNVVTLTRLVVHYQQLSAKAID